jgi:ubiquinone/menaquinone biosynthesis C-methylase UbiE
MDAQGNAYDSTAMAGISFDRAAGFYDATRGLPRDVSDRVADVLAGELAGRGRCLEIGVGTGRIGLPLAERGVDLVGTDIAPAMLARLRQNAGDRLPFPLALADSTDLPLSSRSVGAVLSSHVLHLIADWTVAVDEALRVLAPGGALLVDFGGPTPTPWDRLAREVMAGHGVARVRPGVSDPGTVETYLRGRAGRRPLPAVAFSIDSSLEDDLHEWENQILAWTWPYTPDQMKEACSAIRSAAKAEGWPPDRRVRVTPVIQWWAFDPQA